MRRPFLAKCEQYRRAGSSNARSGIPVRAGGVFRLHGLGWWAGPCSSGLPCRPQRPRSGLAGLAVTPDVFVCLVPSTAAAEVIPTNDLPPSTPPEGRGPLWNPIARRTELTRLGKIIRFGFRPEAWRSLLAPTRHLYVFRIPVRTSIIPRPAQTVITHKARRHSCSARPKCTPREKAPPGSVARRPPRTRHPPRNHTLNPPLRR
jgi:hypothetical protein